MLSQTGVENGGSGIRTHEPLRDGIAHCKGFFEVYLYLESCAFDQASLSLLKRHVLTSLFHGYYHTIGSTQSVVIIYRLFLLLKLENILSLEHLNLFHVYYKARVNFTDNCKKIANFV
jgi:hypothetical protein